MADTKPDNADRHKAEALNLADDYYKHPDHIGDTVQKLEQVFQQALNDGSALELIQKLRSTPYGSPSVDVDGEHRYGTKPNFAANFQELSIEPGFWEKKGKDACGEVDFRVHIDMQKKKVTIKTTCGEIGEDSGVES